MFGSRLSGLLVAAAALLFGSGVVSAQSIVGSAHDFSADNWNNTGEICVVCHTPHNGAIVQNTPLWNHALSTATFTLYAGAGTLDGTIGQPSGVSLLCLSCHDGTVALDSFGGNNGSQPMTGDALVGTDLSNDHPISITYEAGLDAGLRPVTTASGIPGSTGTIADDMLFGASDTVECASCHDVHNSIAGTASLLVKSNNASGLCLTCHAK